LKVLDVGFDDVDAQPLKPLNTQPRGPLKAIDDEDVVAPQEGIRQRYGL